MRSIAKFAVVIVVIIAASYGGLRLAYPAKETNWFNSLFVRAGMTYDEVEGVLGPFHDSIADENGHIVMRDEVQKKGRTVVGWSNRIFSDCHVNITFQDGRVIESSYWAPSL